MSILSRLIGPRRQSSALWAKELNDAIIFHATGWNDGFAGDEFDRQWWEKITKEEFLARRDKSACLYKDRARNANQS